MGVLDSFFSKRPPRVELGGIWEFLRGKKGLIRKLNNLNRRLGSSRNPQVMQEMERIWKKYEEALVQEELLWFQKSRSKWLSLEIATRYSSMVPL